MDDQDIWRTANLHMKSYGDDTELIASKRADAMLDLGDIDGQRVRRRVLAAVRELTTVTPGAKPN